MQKRQLKSLGQRLTWLGMSLCLLVSMTQAQDDSLYINCENPLVFEDRDYGKLDFKIDTGLIIQEQGKAGEIIVVPTKLGELNLSILRGEEVIDKKTFKAIPVPPPTLEVTSPNGVLISPSELAKENKTYRLRLRADAYFEQFFPKEVRYRITNFDVVQFREGRAVKIRTFEGVVLNMESFEILGGDGFMIKVTRAERINSRGQAEATLPYNKHYSFVVK